MPAAIQIFRPYPKETAPWWAPRVREASISASCAGAYTTLRVPHQQRLTPCDELPTGIYDVDHVAGDRISFHTRNGPSVDERVALPEV